MDENLIDTDILIFNPNDYVQRTGDIDLDELDDRYVNVIGDTMNHLNVSSIQLYEHSTISFADNTIQTTAFNQDVVNNMIEEYTNANQILSSNNTFTGTNTFNNITSFKNEVRFMDISGNTQTSSFSQRGRRLFYSNPVNLGTHEFWNQGAQVLTISHANINTNNRSLIRVKDITFEDGSKQTSAGNNAASNNFNMNGYDIINCGTLNLTLGSKTGIVSVQDTDEMVVQSPLNGDVVLKTTINGSFKSFRVAHTYVDFGGREIRNVAGGSQYGLYNTVSSVAGSTSTYTQIPCGEANGSQFATINSDNQLVFTNTGIYKINISFSMVEPSANNGDYTDLFLRTEGQRGEASPNLTAIYGMNFTGNANISSGFNNGADRNSDNPICIDENNKLEFHFSTRRTSNQIRSNRFCLEYIAYFSIGQIFDLQLRGTHLWSIGRANYTITTMS